MLVKLSKRGRGIVVLMPGWRNLVTRMPGVRPGEIRAAPVACGPNGPHGFKLFLSSRKKNLEKKRGNASSCPKIPSPAL